MNQLDIYEWLEYESDPLYQDIKALQNGTKVTYGTLSITFNEHGFYEIETDGVHEYSNSIEKCYDKAKALVVTLEDKPCD